MFVHKREIFLQDHSNSETRSQDPASSMPVLGCRTAPPPAASSPGCYSPASFNVLLALIIKADGWMLNHPGTCALVPVLCSALKDQLALG